MKSSVFYIILVLSTILSSCSKNGDVSTKTGTLMSGKWKLTAVAADEDGDGIFETDRFVTFLDCYIDNLYTFKANNQLELDEGPTKCEPADSQIYMSTWQLTSDEMIMMINTDSYTVEEITNSTLRLKETLSSNRSAKVTFTKV